MNHINKVFIFVEILNVHKMENLPVENYQNKNYIEFKKLILKSSQIKLKDHDEDLTSDDKEDNSMENYLKIIKQINSDILFLQNSQDTSDSIQLIYDLQKHFSNPILINEPNISENLPVNEIFFDMLVSELMLKSDFEFLFSLINLFHLFINIYQDSIISILLQQEYIENIISLFNESLTLDMKNILFDFLFHIFNFNKNSIDRSITYFNDLYQIYFDEIQKTEFNENINITNHFLKYIEKVICFHPQFMSSKVPEISKFIDYIYQRQDLDLFFKPLVDILILLINSCFDAYASVLPCNQVLTKIIENWENEKNLSSQLLNLRFIEKLAFNKFEFEKVKVLDDSIFGQICHLVSQSWKKSTIKEIIKMSLKATHSLMENYDESLPIFFDEQIITFMIKIYQSDQIFEIKKLIGLIVFHIIFVNFEIVGPDNFEDIHDIFNDLNDTNIVNQEIIDTLQQRFDNF